MKRSSQPHLQGFDGLRGLAILLVVVHHVGVFGRWRVGPDLFFVLSGYLTTRSLRNPADSAPWARLLAFHKRRLLRLWPPACALLLGIYPFMMLMPEVDADARHSLLAVLTLSINWQQALTPWESTSLVHLWSLAAELQFYLIWPPLLLLCPRRWTAPLLALAACGAIAWRFWLCGHGADFNRLYFGLDTHADGLVAGCLMAVTELPQRFAPNLRRAGLWALGAIVAAAFVLPLATTGELCWSMTLTTGLAALVVACVPLGGPVPRLLACPPLRAVGRMSYSLYLWNFPVIAFCHPHWHHGEKAAQLALVTAVSIGSYLLIEKPVAAHLRARRQRVMAGGLADRPAARPNFSWKGATRAF